MNVKNHPETNLEIFIIHLCKWIRLSAGSIFGRSYSWISSSFSKTWKEDDTHYYYHFTFRYRWCWYRHSEGYHGGQFFIKLRSNINFKRVQVSNVSILERSSDNLWRGGNEKWIEWRNADNVRYWEREDWRGKGEGREGIQELFMDYELHLNFSRWRSSVVPLLHPQLMIPYSRYILNWEEKVQSDSIHEEWTFPLQT